MLPAAPTAPRDRILQAALQLLETSGAEALSTRVVSAAAGVQAPTIYRQFGDMNGLLDAVATAGFTRYLQTIRDLGPLSSDPVEALREGWNIHLNFGLTHPNLYILMYRTPRPGTESPAVLRAAAELNVLLQRVAEAGRLAVSLERAATLIRAAGEGITLRLLSTHPGDPSLSVQMREAVLTSLLTPEPGPANKDLPNRAAAHAVSLTALLPRLQTSFSAAEQSLLLEWLQRLTSV
jgi:AcrR family transcriptional regulator